MIGEVKILIKFTFASTGALDISPSTGGPEKEEMSMISILSNPARQDRDHTSNSRSRGINRDLGELSHQTYARADIVLKVKGQNSVSHSQ